MGTLTRDPELKHTPKGTAVAALGLAINNRYKSGDEWKEETTFVDVELWGRQAEIAGEYLKKGKPVFIEGRLKLESWEDKTSGQKRSKMKVVGEMLQLLGSRDSGGQDKPPAARPPALPARQADPDLDANTEEDDIPF